MISSSSSSQSYFPAVPSSSQSLNTLPPQSSSSSTSSPPPTSSSSFTTVSSTKLSSSPVSGASHTSSPSQTTSSSSANITQLETSSPVAPSSITSTEVPPPLTTSIPSVTPSPAPYSASSVDLSSTATFTPSPVNTATAVSSATGYSMTSSYWPTTTTLAPSSTTAANWWVPTQIITQSGGNASATKTSTQATATLPQAIAAANQQEQPKGYTLVTIGFKEALNYDFLVSSPLSSAQIFAFLPSILNLPFENQYSNITVYQIVPLRSDTLNYVATVAEVYFPKKEITKLNALITNTSSVLYTAAEGSAKYLAELIDPTIPLTGLVSSTDDSQDYDSSNDNSGSLGSDESFDGALDSSGKSTNVGGSGKTLSKGKIIGLVIGVVVGGCTYVATMVLLIRYFVVKRQIKKSILKDPENASTFSSDSQLDFSNLEKRNMSFNDQESISPSVRIQNWMNHSHYDDVGNVDTQIPNSNSHPRVPKISRPIATQNSLGWNEI